MSNNRKHHPPRIRRTTIEVASTKTNKLALKVTGFEDAQRNETSKQHKLPHQNKEPCSQQEDIQQQNEKNTGVRKT